MRQMALLLALGMTLCSVGCTSGRYSVWLCCPCPGALGEQQACRDDGSSTGSSTMAISWQQGSWS